MCNNRKMTRDLLLEYDINIMPPKPRAAGLGMIYPWENMPITIFSKLLYKTAVEHGFEGTEEIFFRNFINFTGDREIYFNTFSNFPETGSDDMLYFDTEENILYCWKEEYIPVSTLLMDGVILNAGDANV